MQEYSSISVSSFEAGSLAGQLTEQSRDGWSVVAIVPTGSTVTAYLSREAGSSAPAPAAVAAGASAFAVSAAAPEPAVAEPAVFEPVVIEPAPQPAAVVVTPEPTPAVQVAAPAQVSAAPAGWYADPAGRFELRYWDGGTWTEHVSRGGAQFVDPPVA